MQMRPMFKYEINLTTITVAVGLAAMLWDASGRYVTLENQVAKLTTEAANWRDGHLQYHRERATDVSTQAARVDERIKQLETQNRTIDNLSYRMTVQEQGTTSLANAVNELRQTLNALSGDVRITREIVTRIDKGAKTE